MENELGKIDELVVNNLIGGTYYDIPVSSHYYKA
jgi:hypothetical protein